MELPKSQSRAQVSSAAGRPSRSISPNKRRSIVVPSHASYTAFSPNGLPTPARGPSPEHDSQASGEPDVLTALAVQERLVLELKESLAKAEERLVQLRRQWATHESTKRRNESRRMHQMKPMNTSPAKPTNSEEDPDGSSAWMYEEMERRKALLGNTRSSHRRVFSGSREAKTLSLLSPIRVTNDALQSITDPEVTQGRRSRDPVKQMPTPVLFKEAHAGSVQENDVILKKDGERHDSRSPQREAILQTGKQMATDFRDGLWTFFEDLRQVAVGDEVRTPELNPKSSARRNSPGRRAEPRRIQALEESTSPLREEMDAGDSFWKEQGLPEPTPLSTPSTPKRLPKPRSSPQKAHIEVHGSTPDNSWEAWGSPASSAIATKRSSATFSLTSRDPDSASVSSSMEAKVRPKGDRDEEKLKPREAIPWPELTKLAPSNFKRTASQLMAELERSLTPSPRDLEDAGDNSPFLIDHGLMH